MAQTVSVLLSAQGRTELHGIIEDRGRPVKHVQRTRIVLLSNDRLPVLEIAKRIGISRPMVWRWQQRYAEEGLEGLLRDKTRPPGTPPVPQAKVHAVIERTLRVPAGCKNIRADGYIVPEAIGPLARELLRLVRRERWGRAIDHIRNAINLVGGGDKIYIGAVTVSGRRHSR